MNNFILILIFILGNVLSFKIAFKKQEAFERFDIAFECYALGIISMAITMLII